MTAFTYTAERSISGGRVQGNDYSIDVRCGVRDQAPDILKNTRRSLARVSETLLFNTGLSWSIQTGAYSGAELLQLIEFLDSVYAGEAFDFDEFGSVASPDNPVSVIMQGNYRRQRAVRLGDGGANDLFRFSFTIRTE